MREQGGELAALRNDVAQKERELRVALAEFGEATRQSFDPERWIRRNPLLCFGVAVAFGLWLGGRTR